MTMRQCLTCGTKFEPKGRNVFVGLLGVVSSVVMLAALFPLGILVVALSIWLMIPCDDCPDCHSKTTKQIK